MKRGSRSKFLSTTKSVYFLNRVVFSIIVSLGITSMRNTIIILARPSKTYGDFSSNFRIASLGSSNLTALAFKKEI
jgi:hypothetical protein